MFLQNRLKIKKMNKHGWGLKNELIFILIFIICLIVAALGLKQLSTTKEFNPNYYNNTNTSNGDTQIEYNYKNLEIKLKNSTINYVRDVYNNDLGLDTLIIQANLLRQKGYLNNYIDEDNKYCSGYCEVYLDENNEIIYEPYVKCGEFYESKGYMERKDSNE